MLKCVALCYSVLQCVGVCCGMLKCVEEIRSKQKSEGNVLFQNSYILQSIKDLQIDLFLVCCSMLKCAAVCCRVLQCAALQNSNIGLQYVAVCYSALQCAAVLRCAYSCRSPSIMSCSMLQCVTVRCSVLLCCVRSISVAVPQ